MEPSPVLETGDDPPLHTLKPLTQSKRDGTPYARFADVESEIALVIGTHQDTWQVAKLKSETLVYLARWIWPRGDDKALGRVIDQLGRRIARIARDYLGDVSEPIAEELVFDITQEVNLRIFAATPSRQSEFLEVAFRTAIQRRVINAVERHYARSRFEVTSSACGNDASGKDEEMFIEKFPGGEETPLNDLIIEENVRLGLAAITDPRHRDAFVLRYFHGWPIEPSNPETPCLCSHFRKSARMIRIWINTAKAEIEAAVGGAI